MDNVAVTDIKEPEKQYHYYAFISYSSKDLRMAKWLQRKLENYRLPTKIVKKHTGLQKRIFPVFRDETDLAGIVLDKELYKALDESQYLIVLCSPNSVQSDWVKEEIDYFVSLGRKDRIIPFIIDGEPFSADAERECFPQAIKNITPELLGINLPEDGKRNAFISLVSTLLDIRRDELAQRDKARRIAYTSAISALGAAFLIAAFSIIWYYAEHSKYYSSYITEYEIPKGINELTKQQQKNRANSYKITTKAGKVVRLELVNSAKNPCDLFIYQEFAEYPVLEYKYNDDNELIEIYAFDKNRVPVLTKELTRSGKQIAIQYKNSQNSINATAMQSGNAFYKSSFDDAQQKNEVICEINTYDENGYLKTSMYYSDTIGIHGTHACDENGVYGREYTYTEDGQIETIRFLDSEGEYRLNKYGYAGTDYTYEANNVKTVTYVDLNGNVAYCENKYAVGISEYDDFGNVKLLRYLSKDKKTPCNDEEGISKYVFEYENGNCVSCKHFAANGNPATDKNGIHLTVLENYNRNGFHEKQSYFGADGEPINVKEWKYSSIIVKYTDNNLVKENQCFDADGKPCYEGTTGVHGILYEYTNGQISKVCYYDVDGTPKCTKQGYAEYRVSYNEDGLTSRVEYRDEYGKLKRSILNNAVVEYVYDAYGNCTVVQVYDEEELPCYDKDGVSRIEREYRGGKLIWEGCFDTEGAPLLYDEKYHKIMYDYSEGEMTVSYYDTVGALTEGPDNYAKAVYTYDKYGRLIEERYFERDGKTHIGNSAYLEKSEYDERGNVVREEYKSVTPLLYYAKEMKYDDYGYHVYYSDQDGNPVKHDEQPASEHYTYDDKNNVLIHEKRYGSGTIELHEYEYDAFGNETVEKVSLIDEAGNKLFVQYTSEYDAFGNEIRLERRDESGELTANSYGIASAVREYSPEGYVTSECYYDENGAPYLSNGSFRIINEYDSMGNVTKQSYFDEENELLKEEDGNYAYYVYEYNSQGKIVSEAVFNEKNEPMEITGNCHKVETKYNELGEEIEKSYFDKAGNELFSYVYCAIVYEILDADLAELCKIQKDDIIITFGDWNFFNDGTSGSFGKFKSEMLRLRDDKKEILVYRFCEDGGGFVSISADGMMGVRLVDKYIDKRDYESMKEQYEKIYK